jgi:hypothetical protein
MFRTSALYIVDGRLITGQKPAWSTSGAQAFLSYIAAGTAAL